MKHGGDIYNNTIEYDFSVNLNPYKIPETIYESMRRAIDRIGHYPESDYHKLRQSIAEFEGINISGVVCGNGASELISNTVLALNPKKVLLVTPCFTGYLHALGDIPYITYELAQDNGFELTYAFADYLEKENLADIDLLILSDPNNPTGRNIEDTLLERIVKICAKKNIYVLLDRCFYHLSSSYMRWICDADFLDASTIKGHSNLYGYKNLITINAFTKSLAIPGIRIGYLISENYELVKKIKCLLPEWNVSIIADEVGISAAKECANTSFLEKSNKYITKERDFLLSALRSIGLRVFPSDTNYLLFFTEVDLYNLLLEKNILIRDCADIPGLRQGYYRIAVKSHDENIILCDEIRDILCN